MLEIAESRRVAAGVENFEFVQADVQSLEWSEPFDAIVARLLLFHLPDREAVLRRQLDPLRPGGTVVVAEFDCQGEWLGAIRVRRQRAASRPCQAPSTDACGAYQLVAQRDKVPRDIGRHWCGAHCVPCDRGLLIM